MKRLFSVCILLLALSIALLPAAAQATTADPAAYLPARTSIYLELRTDEAGSAALVALSDLNANLSGQPQGASVYDLLTPRIAQLLPGIDQRADILPWLGDRIAISAATAPGASPQSDDFIFVLPIRDPAGAQAFAQKAAAGAVPQDAGGVQIYTLGAAKLAVGTSVMWLGASASIDSLFSFGALENLSQNPAYQQVRAALPADAAVTAYLSGRLVSDAAQQNFAPADPTAPTLQILWQTALRLHPAQSLAEAALLASPNLNGAGFAVQITDVQADLTAALSVSAQYPAPTLPTASAGTALLDLIPPDSLLAFASYDVLLPAFAGGAYAWLTTPVVGELFSTVTNALSATPTPSPTPEPITADLLLEQIEPIIRQAESTMGLSRDELYALINGKYAFAAFPNGGSNIGAALYIQSSDPQRLIDTLDHVSHLILTNPAPVEQLITLEQTTINGIAVTLVGSQNLGERLALGILNGSVLFIAPESSTQHVIDAASDATLSPASAWRDRFGMGQEAMLYADPRAIDLVLTGQERTPPLVLSGVAGTLDVRGNGLFVLHLSAALTQ